MQCKVCVYEEGGLEEFVDFLFFFSFFATHQRVKEDL